MSDTLFQKITSTLRRELREQISETSNIYIDELPNDNNAVYRIASLLPGSISPRHVAAIRLINDISKRYVGDDKEKSETRDKACWAKFVLANDLCGKQNENFAELDSDVYTTLEIARGYIEDAFWKASEEDDFPFSWFNVDKPGDQCHGEHLIPIDGFSSGPGSCTGASGKSIMEKYRNGWFTSTGMGIQYLRILRKFHKPINDLRFFAVGFGTWVKATFVLKDKETSRLIAPQLNGDLFLQYPAAKCLRLMLKLGFNIEMETQQDKNREAARKGSLHDNCDIYDFSIKRRAWRPCTIDLVSASDIIGTELCKFFLNPVFYKYMACCRGDTMLGYKSVKTRLNMMATMGNAYCSPLQTIVFAAICKAVYYRLGIETSDSFGQTYGVYGDDIIVDVTAYDAIVDILIKLGMKPNHKKSFSTGFFRESCGGDYFMGYDVRPIFTEAVDSDTARYSLLNRLIDWGVRHSFDLSATCGVITAALEWKTVVPMDMGEHQGLRVPGAALKALPNYWKRNLVASSTLVCAYDSPLYERFHPWIRLRRPRWSRNWYSQYLVTVLDKVSVQNYVRLTKYEQSLFPFLRGGVRQREVSKITRSNAVSSRAFEVPAEGAFEVKEVVPISLWDVPGEQSRLVQRYFADTLVHYSHAVLRVLERPCDN